MSQIRREENALVGLKGQAEVDAGTSTQIRVRSGSTGYVRVVAGRG